MPGTTTGGLPYPLDHEPLADIAEAVQDLAEALDTVCVKLVRNTNSQPVPPSANTVVTYLAATYARGITYSLATGKITATVAGLYNVSGGLLWDTNAVGRRFAQLVKTSGGVTENLGRDERGATGYVGHQVATDIKLAVGDTVHLEVFQSSAGNLNLRGDFSPAVLAAHRVGPLP